MSENQKYEKHLVAEFKSAAECERAAKTVLELVEQCDRVLSDLEKLDTRLMESKEQATVEEFEKFWKGLHVYPQAEKFYREIGDVSIEVMEGEGGWRDPRGKFGCFQLGSPCDTELKKGKRAFHFVAYGDILLDLELLGVYMTSEFGASVLSVL